MISINEDISSLSLGDILSNNKSGHIIISAYAPYTIYYLNLRAVKMIKWEQHELESVPVAILAGADTNRLELLNLFQRIRIEKSIKQQSVLLYGKNDELIADNITLDFIDNSDEYFLSLNDNSMILITLHNSNGFSSKLPSNSVNSTSFTNNNNNKNKQLSITASNTNHHLYTNKSYKLDKRTMSLYIDSPTSDDFSGLGTSSNGSGDDSGSESSGSLGHHLTHHSRGSITDRHDRRKRGISETKHIEMGDNNSY